MVKNGSYRNDIMDGLAFIEKAFQLLICFEKKAQQNGELVLHCFVGVGDAFCCAVSSVFCLLYCVLSCFILSCPIVVSCCVVLRCVVLCCAVLCCLSFVLCCLIVF